jgi:hypothetical protein
MSSADLRNDADAAVMTDREHLRRAIIALHRRVWRLSSKARELEKTYLAKYGVRGQRPRVRREIAAMNREALATAFGVSEEVLPPDIAASVASVWPGEPR